MKVYLIRHTSVDVPAGTCYGQTDVPLRDSFEEEADAVFNRIEGMKFDKVYTSPLSRCLRLASYCGYTDAKRDHRLKEIDFGKWEMQKFSEIKDARIEEWYEDFLHVPATGGESFMDLYGRVASFLDELKQADYRRVLIFAHGGVLICAQAYAGVIDISRAFDALSSYGGMVEIDL